MSDYTERVKRLTQNLEPGTIIQFGHGRSFEVQSFLGGGGTNLIFDLGDGRVLRIANQTDLIGSIPGFLESVAAHSEVAFPIAEIDWEACGDWQEFVVQKKINFSYFKLDEFNARYERLIRERNISPAELKHITSKLVEFIAQAGDLRFSLDLCMANIVWDGTEWIYFDPLVGPDRATSPKDMHFIIEQVVSKLTGLPRDLQKRLASIAIRSRRHYLNSLHHVNPCQNWLAWLGQLSPI